MTSGRFTNLALPVAVLAMVAMIAVPLPVILIDLLLVLMMALSVCILLTSMVIRRPMEFSVFPGLLLVLTMLRLALNVSTTRAILSTGYAGKVIDSFGSLVIGSNMIVGLVVFFILAIVQFVVVTSGAGRAAEVAARFKLDAMPGKQMAIDADLNAGNIDQDEASRRREEVANEADFYGAMDGASKFVKGDAIATVVIVLVNLIGGFTVGSLQQGLSLGESISTYSLLTVGDGLVAQLPALLVSIASGIILTKGGNNDQLGSTARLQFAAQSKAVTVGGAAIAVLGLAPGLPLLPFVTIGSAIAVAGWWMGRSLATEAATEAAAAEADLEEDIPTQAQAAANLITEARVDPLELALSYDLIELVDGSTEGDLLERMTALRRKLALSMGVIIPPVRTFDDASLPPATYVLRVHGVEVGRGEAPAGRVMAISDRLDSLPGEATTEPVFGLPAKWIPIEFRPQAEALGATVVPRSALIVTHLSEVARTHAGELLSRTDVKDLVETVRATDPTVVDELTSASVTFGELQAVLCGLLEEEVAIRDLVRILEAVSETVRHTRDTDSLVEAARARLGPAIGSSFARNGTLSVVTLDPMLEHDLATTLQRPDGSAPFLALDPQMAEQLVTSAAARIQAAAEAGLEAVVVCAPQLRSALRRVLALSTPAPSVLSYAELGNHLRIETVGVIRKEEDPSDPFGPDPSTADSSTDVPSEPAAVDSPRLEPLNVARS